MENRTIEISKTKLSKLLSGGHHGSTDWDICYNTVTGEIADLHNTSQRGDWVVIIDLYYTTYDDVENWTANDWENLLDEQGIESVTILEQSGESFGLPDYNEINLYFNLI